MDDTPRCPSPNDSRSVDMADRNVYAAGPLRYKNRMLQAGERVVMPGPRARMYEALGQVTFTRPRKVKAEVAAPEPVTTAPAAPASETVAEPTADPASPVVVADKPDPLDHDGDGKKGGSKKGAQSTRARFDPKAKVRAKRK